MPKLTLEGCLTVTEVDYEDPGTIEVNGEPLRDALEEQFPSTARRAGVIGWTTDYGRARVTIETLEEPQDA